MQPKTIVILTIFLTLVFLSACGSQPTAVSTPTEAPPAPTSTAVPALEPTPEVGFTPTFEPEPCPFDLPPSMIEGDDVDCGFVVVPADHQDPSAGTLRLAVVVVRDQSENHQPEPVILLSGGPGEKTVANALPASQIFAPYFPNRDFIIFDQRGVGLSEPALECPEWGEALFGLMDETDPEVFMKASYDSLMTCRDRLVAEGHDLSVYNTVQNAADVDAIRQALGYEHLNLLGGSYGSILAQEAARQHPDTTRSVILAATWPLEQSFFIGVSETSSAALLSMLEACEQDEACSDAYPHLQDVLFELIERLDTEPVDITITNPLDGESYDAVLAGRDLINNLTLFLYLTDLIPTLPEAIYDVYNGDYDLMTRLQSISLLLYGATTRGMLYSVVCAEDLIGQTPEDLLAAREQLPPQFLGDLDPEDIIQYGIFGICENWPVEQVDPSFKRPWESDIPTLLLEGEFDPVTPIEYANMVAAHLDNSYVLEFPGIGHGVLASSKCALSIAGDFIDDPSQAPAAVCIAEMPEMAFDLPREEQGELALKPFTHEGYGLQALGPEGWESPRTGVFVRGDSAIDQTALIYDVSEMDQEDFVQLLKAQLSLPESPEPVDEIESNGFEWTLYHEEVRGVAVDVATTPFGEEGTLAVILQSDAGEQEVLYENVFLPAVRAVALLDAAAADFSFASPESQDMDPEALAELVEIVSVYVEDEKVVGAELAVIKNREIVLHEAFGWKDKDDGLALETDSLYNIRSMTKPITGMAIQMLVDEGKLALDDRVADYLPSFDNERSGEITVEQLLSHRSGLPLSTVITGLGEIDSLRALADDAGEKGPEIEPGSYFHYSDTGSDVLGALVEEISGMPLGEFWQERIFDPLAMADTISMIEEDDPRVGRIASGYYGSTGDWSRYWGQEDELIFPFTMGSQSVYSTILDYARFLALWMDGGQMDGQQQLSSEAVERALTPVVASNLPGGFPGLRLDYGQQWIVYVPEGAPEGEDEMMLFGHSGSDGTWAWAWPEQDLMVFYFTQSRGQGSGVGLEGELDRLLIHPDQEVVAIPEELKPYLGVYTALSGPLMNKEFEVLVQNGKLAVNLPEQIVVALQEPDEENLWRLTIDPSIAVSFVQNGAGEVVALNWHQAGQVFEVPRGEAPEEEPLDEASVQKYLGFYTRPEEEDTEPVEILIHNDHLGVKMPEVAVVLELYPPDEDGRWAIRLNPAVTISFQEDKDGEVVSFTSHSPEGDFVRPRVDSDSIVVPAGTPPTIDGTLSPGEWDKALVEILSDGSELLLMHADDYLYLGVRSNTPEMTGANIYIEDNGQIIILHTSAALGTAIYEQGADSWQQTQEFDWQCRNRGDSVAAQAERSAYLQENHWLAANSRMGAPNELEYQIEVTVASQRIAVSVFRSSTPDERAFWPATLDDDTIQPNPGGLPPELHFSPEQWGMLNLKNLGEVEKN